MVYRPRRHNDFVTVYDARNFLGAAVARIALRMVELTFFEAAPHRTFCNRKGRFDARNGKTCPRKGRQVARKERN